MILTALEQDDKKVTSIFKEYQAFCKNHTIQITLHGLKFNCILAWEYDEETCLIDHDLCKDNSSKDLIWWYKNYIEDSEFEYDLDDMIAKNSQKASYDTAIEKLCNKATKDYPSLWKFIIDRFECDTSTAPTKFLTAWKSHLNKEMKCPCCKQPLCHNK